jgi:hypothetical protein
MADPEHHNRLNEIMTAPDTEEVKPQMKTEAAKKIPVPSWWQGGTTISDATMVLENMRKKP